MAKVEQNVGSLELKPAALCEILGCSRRNLDNLILKGMPKLGERKTLRFNAREAFAWYREYDRGLSKAKEAEIPKDKSFPDAELRKMNAEATLKELKVKQQMGLLVSVEDVIFAQSQVNGNIRARLLSMPAKVAQRFAGDERTRVKSLIEREVNETLLELSRETASGIEFSEEQPDE